MGLQLNRSISVFLSGGNDNICDHIWHGDLISTIPKDIIEGQHVLQPTVTTLYKLTDSYGKILEK